MKILVTGGHGLVGNALSRLDTQHNIVCVGRKDYNLLVKLDVDNMFSNHKPDCVIHLAAKVGGIKGNIDKPATFFYENILINTNVLHAAYEHRTQKVVSMLSTCIFPEEVRYPIRETHIHDGQPHDSNFAYSYAKRMLEVQSRSYRKQHGNNFVTAVPNNLFGENDNFHPNDSHVIPAMIRKFHDAVKHNLEEIKLWGDGTPLREFTYSKDIAKQLVFIAEKYDEESPINLGNNEEVSIKNLACAIQKISKFKGRISWDTRMPVGQLRKPSDKSRIINMGWDMSRFTKFSTALERTYRWYEENYPDVRGVN